MDDPASSSAAAEAGFRKANVVLAIKDVLDCGGQKEKQDVEIAESDSERYAGQTALDYAISCLQGADQSGLTTAQIEVVSGGPMLIREVQPHEFSLQHKGPGISAIALGVLALPVSDDDVRRLNLLSKSCLVIKDVQKGGITGPFRTHK